MHLPPHHPVPPCLAPSHHPARPSRQVAYIEFFLTKSQKEQEARQEAKRARQQAQAAKDAAKKAGADGRDANDERV